MISFIWRIYWCKERRLLFRGPLADVRADVEAASSLAMHIKRSRSGRWWRAWFTQLLARSLTR